MKTQIEKLKQGCGKERGDYRCGQMENLKHSDHVLLCSTCQAKLSQAQEDEKRFNNFVEKLKKTNKKCIKSMPINKETCKIELNQETIINIINLVIDKIVEEMK